jgi:hypothetical protein
MADGLCLFVFSGRDWKGEMFSMWMRLIKPTKKKKALILLTHKNGISQLFILSHVLNCSCATGQGSAATLWQNSRCADLSWREEGPTQSLAIILCMLRTLLFSLLTL